MPVSRRQKNYTQSEFRFLLVFQYKDNDRGNRYYIKEGNRFPMSRKDAMNVGRRLSIENPDMKFSIVQIDQDIEYPVGTICPNCGVEVS